VDIHNHLSIGNSLDYFVSESNKLQEGISHALKNSECLHMADIIGLYFQVIDVSSFAKFLRENIKEFEKSISEEALSKVKETEEYIDLKFNSFLHPLLMVQLEKTIEESKINLKNMKTKLNSKTNSEIENQAKMFEKLRQLMSTKEFVNQYDKVISRFNVLQ